ncbi:MAG: glutathione synthetase [Planctomycetota bacterium]|jgi:glutathione synthase
MRIAFFVNDVQTEKSGYTTTRLAYTATNRGHEVWFIGANDFAYDPDDMIRARARQVTPRKYKSLDSYLRVLQGPTAIEERISVRDLDVLMLRSDPADDAVKRPWAQNVGILFGQFAVRQGVVVVNDPTTLANAMNKMYFQLFPEEVRPRTLITRDRTEIRHFAKEEGTVVIKPVQGSGGTGVFLVRPDDLPNLNQMIDSVSRDGYVIVQEYLKEAEQGDMRFFMMNGQPLRHRGRYAAFRRNRSGGDLRSNLHAGGKKAQAIVDDRALRIAEIVRPKLVADGMFLVGLDIVGDKLMEVNVFSPGGLGSAYEFEKVSFSGVVMDALERKVQYAQFYKRVFNNIDMATL